NFSYDLYNVMGQGIGGMYRPYRSDYGIVYDSRMENDGGGVSVGGIEIAMGDLNHDGINVSVNTSFTETGKWNNDNPAAAYLKFHGSSPTGDIAYEPYYFKQAGEKTAETDNNFFNSLGGFTPVKVGIHPAVSSTLPRFEDSNGSII